MFQRTKQKCNKTKNKKFIKKKKPKRSYITNKKYKKYTKKRSYRGLSKTRKRIQKGGKFDEKKACSVGFAYNWSPDIMVDNDKLIKQYERLSPKGAPKAALLKTTPDIIKDATVGIIPELAGLNPNDFKLKKIGVRSNGTECGDWAWLGDASTWEAGGATLPAYRYKNNGEEGNYKICSKKGATGLSAVKCPKIVNIKSVGGLKTPTNMSSWLQARNQQLNMNSTSYGDWNPLSKTWESLWTGEATDSKQEIFDRDLLQLKFFSILEDSKNTPGPTKLYAKKKKDELYKKLVPPGKTDPKIKKKVNDVIIQAKGDVAYTAKYEEELNKKAEDIANEKDQIKGDSKKQNIERGMVDSKYKIEAEKEALKEKNNVILFSYLFPEKWKSNIANPWTKKNTDTYVEELKKQIDIIKKGYGFSREDAKNFFKKNIIDISSTWDNAKQNVKKLVDQQEKKQNLIEKQKEKKDEFVKARNHAEELAGKSTGIFNRKNKAAAAAAAAAAEAAKEAYYATKVEVEKILSQVTEAGRRTVNEAQNIIKTNM